MSTDEKQEEVRNPDQTGDEDQEHVDGTSAPESPEDTSPAA